MLCGHESHVFSQRRSRAHALIDGSSDASGDDGKALFTQRGDACENTASKDISHEESDRSGEREKSLLNPDLHHSL
jgi:hypothetical protein